jgi:hypothetical protein
MSDENSGEVWFTEFTPLGPFGDQTLFAIGGDTIYVKRVGDVPPFTWEIDDVDLK